MSRSTGRIRLAIQFMSRRENWFISSSPITLAPLRSFLSADAVHHAADWTPALLLAAQSDRGLVGLRLPDPVPTAGRSRPSAGWLFAVTVLPFSSVVFPRSPRPIAALGWVKANRPAAVLYSDSLRRHASFYWRERPAPSRRPTPTAINSGASSSQGALCCLPMPTSAGLAGQKSRRSSAKQRIHDKHHFEFIFEFGKSDRTRVETPSVND
jgi:hypothetical protein